MEVNNSLFTFGNMEWDFMHFELTEGGLYGRFFMTCKSHLTVKKFLSFQMYVCDKASTRAYHLSNIYSLLSRTYFTVIDEKNVLSPCLPVSS